MNSIIANKKLVDFFDGAADSLDVSDSLYQKAEERYKAIARWLERSESGINNLQPHIYSQGSFALGTVIKPYNDADQYDIDVVCTVALDKLKMSQKQLKELVGTEIISYARANSMTNPAKEGKRCWTLEYSEGAQFHMDILPSIPEGADLRLLLESRRMNNEWAQHAIAITDNTEITYSKISGQWPVSNPKGYALWFRERMKAQFDKQRRILAESVRGKIDEVPDYKVKTPLQRSVQLLKRHRDMMFSNDLDNKPISIIITTLAALSYKNEDNVAEALSNIVRNMKLFIERRQGKNWVVNPVNPLENFADKWVQYPERQENFFRWLRQVENDFSTAVNSAGEIQQLANNLQPRLGSSVINEAVENAKRNSVPQSIISKTVGGIKALFQVSHRQGLIWTYCPQYLVKISGRIRENDNWHPFQSNCAPLPKGCNLSFLAKTDVPEPYDVYWQVVNTGEEASKVDNLRGKIFPAKAVGKGGLIQDEATKYTGTHWIECFSVKNSTCVARSGEYIVNIA